MSQASIKNSTLLVYASQQLLASDLQKQSEVIVVRDFPFVCTACVT